MKRKIFISFILGMVFIGFQGFRTIPRNNSVPSNAPASTIITLTHDGALEGTGYWVDDEYRLYPYRQIKVVFTGNRFSDGQTITDPNCPIIETTYGYPTCTVSLANYYYRNGHVSVYSRSYSGASWIYKGDMNMSSSNCTMDGSKVLTFTVDCRYLAIP